MEQEILSFLEYAVMAPSADNNQPWRVVLRPKGFDLFNRAEPDAPIYNWRNAIASLSHGAFIENFALAAAAKNYQTRVTPFPQSANSDHIATIEIVASGNGAGTADPLYEAMPKRSTNRKPYEKTALTASEKQELLANAQAPGSPVSIRFCDAAADVERLGNAAAVTEQILFTTRSMHRLFFGNINWTKEQNEKRRSGFTMESLELPPPAKVLFKLWKHWPIMKLFAAIGFPNVIAKENGKLYGSAAGFAAVVIPDGTPASYLAAGRAFERLWLSAAHLGLSLHPLTGIPALYEYLKNEPDNLLTPTQRQAVTQAYQVIAEAVQPRSGEVIAAICRIGKAEAPSGRTSRRSVQELMAS